LERPFIVYADFECSLIPTEMSDKIAKHAPNSAAAYFVCTFDSNRNKYYLYDHPAGDKEVGGGGERTRNGLANESLLTKDP